MSRWRLMFTLAALALVGGMNLYAGGGQIRLRSAPTTTTTTTTTGDTANTYYNYLRSTYSANEVVAVGFRSQADINAADDNSCTDGTPDNPKITYNATADMARIAIPPWSPIQADVCWTITDRTLAEDLDLTETDVTMNIDAGDPGDSIKCDNEIMLIVSYPGGAGNLTVQRHYASTAAATHTNGTVCYLSTNNPWTQLNTTFAPGIATGETVLYHWETVATDSYRIQAAATGPGYKQFQILSSGHVKIEPRWLLDFNPDDAAAPAMISCMNTAVNFAAADIRQYDSIYDDNPTWTDRGVMGPNTSVDNDTGGTVVQNSGFVHYCFRPGIKYSYWLRIKRKAGDWSPVSYWVRAEDEGSATKLYDETQWTFPNAESINGFWWEGNTSGNYLVLGGRGLTDLVSCYANLWIGKVTGDASAGAFSDSDMTTNHLSHAPVQAGTCS